VSCVFWRLDVFRRGWLVVTGLWRLAGWLTVLAGRYVFLVTLYDRIGGQPLRWSKRGIRGGVGVNQPSASQPVAHRGRFYDTQMDVDQRLYSLGPAEPDTKPSMVYVIEMFLLGNRRYVGG